MFQCERNEQRRSRVGIVANPYSGVGKGRDRVLRLGRELESKGLESDIAWDPSTAIQVIENARNDNRYHALVAAGGDGTISRVCNYSPEVPITVLASGTENLFAKHFRLPRHPASLAKLIQAGQSMQLDLGTAGDRRFILMLSAGFDADVITQHHLGRTRHRRSMRPTSRFAYVSAVLNSSLNYRFPVVHVRVNDPGPIEVRSGAMVFLFNLPLYALGLPVAPRATGTDGLLDLVIFRDPGAFAALRVLWNVFRGCHLEGDGVWHRQVRSVTLSAEEPTPLQADGDPFGSLQPGHPITVGVIPDALRVLRGAR